MRLTLRTLLAYLDDTLDANEIKEIGQKVTESDAAQELMARIKQVTRRRRLTTPSNGGAGQAFDSNKVAEYFESELSADEMTEIEKICLESDVHLAEVAAVHQILALVQNDLERPILIPPAAKQRMYDLIHGRKEPRAVKPAPVAASTTTGKAARDHDTDSEDTLLLGLPLFRQAPWLRWALPVAAAVLLATFGVVVWKVLSDSTDSGPRAAKKGSTPTGNQGTSPSQDTRREQPKPPGGGQPPKNNGKNNGANSGNGGGSVKNGANDKKQPMDPVTPPGGNNKPPMPKPPAIVTFPKGTPPERPSTGRKIVGKFSSKDALLLRKSIPPAKVEWRLVEQGRDVWSGEQLVSLPGYQSSIELGSGIQLTMWGNVPEHFPFFVRGNLLESAVTLRDNPELDLELTLERGRIFIVNNKPKKDDDALVRIRFWSSATKSDEVWDLILRGSGTEVGIELLSRYRGDQSFRKGDAPETTVGLYVLSGEIDMKSGEYNIRAPIKKNYLRAWQNRQDGLEEPRLMEQLRSSHWKKGPHYPKLVNKVKAATQEFHARMVKNTGMLENGLLTSMMVDDPIQRYVTLRSFGALDMIPNLLEEMTAEDKQNRSHANERLEAISVLRHWLSRGPDQYNKLYDPEKGTGLLRDAGFGFTHAEARTITELLHYFSPEQREQPETYQLLLTYLLDKKLVIRELANLQLQALVYWKKVNYYAAAAPEQLQKGYEEWKRLIPPGKVPQPPKEPDRP